MILPRMSSSAALVACATSLVLTLSGCGSDTDASAGSSAPSKSTAGGYTGTELATSFAEPPAVASPCPSAPPQNAGTPEWTLPGATGSVAVTGSTDTAAPVVTVTEPFSVTETQVRTLKAGDGPVVPNTATVSVCYMGVNGRDGSVFDSSYAQGAPVQFGLAGVVPGFRKAIAGQTVGSTVAVAMMPADGYPEGEPRAGILPGDTLIFAIKVLDATS